MTKKVLLRCNENNVSICIEGNAEKIEKFVNWIIEHNYQTQRYPENNLDVLEFAHSNLLVACKLKAIKMELVPIVNHPAS